MIIGVIVQNIKLLKANEKNIFLDINLYDSFDVPHMFNLNLSVPSHAVIIC